MKVKWEYTAKEKNNRNVKVVEAYDWVDRGNKQAERRTLIGDEVDKKVGMNFKNSLRKKKVRRIYQESSLSEWPMTRPTASIYNARRWNEIKEFCRDFENHELED